MKNEEFFQVTETLQVRRVQYSRKLLILNS